MPDGRVNRFGIHVRDNLAAWTWGVLAALICFGISYFVVRHADIEAAVRGFSPISMLHPVTTGPNFGQDFPNGDLELQRSLLGRAYRLVGSVFPSSDTIVLTVMIVLEAGILLASAAILCRRLNPDLPAWTAIGGGVLLASGTIVSCDLARWFHPSYGYVYNIAYAAGFLAVAATLRRRLVWAGLLVGLAATFHPIIAFFFGLAVGSMVLWRWREYSLGSALLGGAVAVLVAAAWYLVAFRDAGIAAGDINHARFASVTHLMSFHWHPVDMGVFGKRAWETLLPLLAAVIVFAANLRLAKPETSTGDQQILVAVALLMAVSLVGVWISMQSTSPLLIKLALHRASLIALMLMAALSVPRMLEQVRTGNFLLAVAAGVLLLLPYWRTNAMPILGGIGFGVLVLLMSKSGQSQLDRRLTISALALAVVVCVALYLNGYFSAIVMDTNMALAPLTAPLFAIAIVLVVAARMFSSPLPLAAAVALGAYSWGPALDTMTPQPIRHRATAYMDAQLWARNNTPEGSVFMLDPTMAYGWRLYSQRPSFGVIREWIHSGWIYDTNAAVMAEGLRRAEALGLDVWRYADAARSDNEATYAQMMRDAEHLYYERGGAALQDFARQNGIAYMVFDKEKNYKLPDLPIVFENDTFAILKP